MRCSAPENAQRKWRFVIRGLSSSHRFSQFTSKFMSYSIQHLKETAEIVAKINPEDCEKCVRELVGVRTRGGRLFILGVGGSAANASHAVNDFRKIAGLECYAPTEIGRAHV